ncbi:MAG: hypothetical protein V4569_19215, partial [Pseudomonadota bacterium]
MIHGVQCRKAAARCGHRATNRQPRRRIDAARRGRDDPYNRRTPANPPDAPMQVNAACFKAYDIRGIVGAG